MNNEKVKQREREIKEMAIGSSKETETVGHTERMRLREGKKDRKERK